MEEHEGIPGILDWLETVEHCSECGHAWVYDEPAHHADCRFYVLDEQLEDDEEGSDILGWTSYRIVLP